MKKEIKGLENLTPEEELKVEKVIESNIKKIEKRFSEPSNLKVHIKVYSEEGERKKTSINIELRVKTRKFNVDSQEWNSHVAVKNAFEKLMTLLEHEFHTSDTHHAHRKKPKSLQKPKDFIKLKEDLEQDRI
ncbi:MAG: hypothetical protein Q8P81_02755 [Nanoarchaeota archaeon]|nr:hypothetical protein [Nanoarchaeota archaeon]